MIKVKRVSKKYHNNIIFDNISFCLPSTGLVFLEGSSGSGKTTLFNMIYGIDNEYKGKIEVEGSISYMTQDDTLFDNISVKENLNIFSDDIDDWLNYFSLYDKKDEKVSLLSLGERKRISFILSMIKKSNIYFLDEPFAYLDEANKYKILDVLKKKSEDSLIVVASHELLSEKESYIKINHNKVKCFYLKEKEVRKIVYPKIKLRKYLKINSKNILKRNIMLLVFMLLMMCMFSFVGKKYNSEDLIDFKVYELNEKIYKKHKDDYRVYIEYELKEKTDVFVLGNKINDYEFVALKDINKVYVNDVFYSKYGSESLYIDIDEKIIEERVYRVIKDNYVNPLIYIPYEKYLKYTTDTMLVALPDNINVDEIGYDPYTRIDTSFYKSIDRLIKYEKIITYFSFISIWVLVSFILFEINKRFYKNLRLNVSGADLLIYLCLERIPFFLFLFMNYLIVSSIVFFDILITFYYLNKRIKVMMKC